MVLLAAPAAARRQASRWNGGRRGPLGEAALSLLGGLRPFGEAIRGDGETRSCHAPTPATTWGTRIRSPDLQLCWHPPDPVGDQGWELPGGPLHGPTTANPVRSVSVRRLRSSATDVPLVAIRTRWAFQAVKVGS